MPPNPPTHIFLVPLKDAKRRHHAVSSVRCTSGGPEFPPPVHGERVRRNTKKLFIDFSGQLVSYGNVFSWSPFRTRREARERRPGNTAEDKLQWKKCKDILCTASVNNSQRSPLSAVLIRALESRRDWRTPQRRSRSKSILEAGCNGQLVSTTSKTWMRR